MVSRWQIHEEHTGKKGFHQLRHVVMELPKYTTGEHPKTHIDKWVYFFRETESLRTVSKELSNEVYQEAFEVTRIANMTEDEYEAYERAKMAEQDARGQLSHTKKGFKKALRKAKSSGCMRALRKANSKVFAPPCFNFSRYEA